MVGGLFCFFSRRLNYWEKYEYRILLVIHMLLLIQHSRKKVNYSHPKKNKNSVGHEPAVPNWYAVTLVFKYMNTIFLLYFQDVRCEFDEFQVSAYILNLLVGTYLFYAMWMDFFLGGVLFFYKQMFCSTTSIGVIVFTFFRRGTMFLMRTHNR